MKSFDFTWRENKWLNKIHRGFSLYSIFLEEKYKNLPPYSRAIHPTAEQLQLVIIIFIFLLTPWWSLAPMRTYSAHLFHNTWELRGEKIETEHAVPYYSRKFRIWEVGLIHEAPFADKFTWRSEKKFSIRIIVKIWDLNWK